MRRTAVALLGLAVGARAPTTPVDVGSDTRGQLAPSATQVYELKTTRADVGHLAAELSFTAPLLGQRPDPILMVAHGRPPAVFFTRTGDVDGDGSADGQLSTNASYFDEVGFLLSRERQFVSVPPAELRPGSWFFAVTNVGVWSQGRLDFRLRLSLSDTAPCQASCSGAGSCVPSDACAAEQPPPPGVGAPTPQRGLSPSRTTPAFAEEDKPDEQAAGGPRCVGSCECEAGYGDVDCSVPLLPIVPDAISMGTPTITSIEVPLQAGGAAALSPWQYYAVTISGTSAVPPGLSIAQPTQWTASLPGFIAAELTLPPPPSTLDGVGEDPGSIAGAGAASQCQALLYFKREDEGFSRLPSHYDFQRYSDPAAFYGGLRRYHVDLPLQEGRYIAGIYMPEAGAPGCAPAELTVSACPSGNALECRYYALGSASSQARLFVAMLIAAGLPMICCLPALFCHVMSWLTGGGGDDDEEEGGQQYQLIEPPRPGLSEAQLRAHTIPIIFDSSLPQQLADEHCSICIGEFEVGEELRQLKCSHFFHKSCIDEWLARVDICPLCKCSAVQGPSTPRPRAAPDGDVEGGESAGGGHPQPEPEPEGEPAPALPPNTAETNPLLVVASESRG